MAFQGVAIFAVSIGLASLLYYIFANNGTQEQAYGNSGSGSGSDNGGYYNFNSWNEAANIDNSGQHVPRRKRSSKKYNRNTECIICLHEITARRTILPCSHSFHENCINKWKSHGPEVSRDTCPICRGNY